MVKYHNVDDEVQYLGDEYIYSTENKVYNFHHGAFNLLYDYSLEVGDSIELFLGANSDLYAKLGSDVDRDTTPKLHKVTKVDSIKIEGNKHHAIVLEFIRRNDDSEYFPFFHDTYIIKGIGSTTFLTGDMTASIEFDYYGPLRCYTDSSINYTTDILCDTLISSTDEILSQEEITIYPVPSDNHLYIQSNMWKIKEIKIFDLSGKLILSVKGNNENLYVINTKSLNKGPKIVFLRTEKNVINQKIILK